MKYKKYLFSVQPKILIPSDTDAAVNPAENTVLYDLRVEDLCNPLGIDTARPRFSWKMRSTLTGQRQTAYKIEVSGNPHFTDLIWNSGFISSDLSVGIPYEGPSLTTATEYFWRVTVQDLSNRLILSETAFFETGLMGPDPWADSFWIQQGEENKASEEVRYTVEADLTCTKGALGLLFNIQDSYHYYMCQLDVGRKPGTVLCRLQPRIGWYPTGEDCLEDVTAFTGTPEELRSVPVNVRIEVSPHQITVFLNGQQAIQKAVSAFGPDAPKLQARGIGINTERGEAGTLGFLKLTDYSDSAEGKVLYNYSFRSGNPFAGGRLINGRLAVHAEGDLLLPGGSTTFRKEITPAKALDSARLYVTGLGIVDFFIDGQRVGHLQPDGSYIYDELKPGYTQQSGRMHYYTYDITHLLKEGYTSTLSAHVVPGWWSGIMTCYYGKKEALRAKLLLRYADGSTEWIRTDGTWRSALMGPVLYSDFYNGEIYDGSTDLSFRQTGYEDGGWNFAGINTEFSGTVCAKIGPSVRIRPDLELLPRWVRIYDRVEGAAGDRYGKIQVTRTYRDGDRFPLKPAEKAIIDLGQNFSGWDEICVQGKKGTILTVRHGEMLNDKEGLYSRGNDGPEGSLYTSNLRAALATGRYILHGDETECYHSTTAFYGFRYLEITATQEVTLYRVKGLAVTSVPEDTGHLETSDQRVNRLIRNTFWGQYSNYLSVPTDCPQRDERRGWTADAHIFSTTAAYNADSKGFLRKYICDINDSQAPNGAFPDLAPYSHGLYGQCGWGDAGIIIPYNMYKMYGDRRFIEENYSAMQKYIDEFLASTDKKGGGHSYGDWLSYEENDAELKLLFSVAYYAHVVHMMAEMARCIGKEEDARRYSALFGELKIHFQELFVYPDGTLKRTEQTACLMALNFNLLPDPHSVQVVKEALLKNIRHSGTKLQTGFLGTALLLQTLSEIGETDMAYQLLLQRECPSWLYSVGQGATTVWERWDSYTAENGFGDVNMNSFNHYAYGAVAEWMYCYMAGIMYDLRSPGFKHFILQPSPNRVFRYVNCTYESAYGQIISSWKYEGSQLIYTAGIPANTSATVRIPCSEVGRLRVNGAMAANVSPEADGLEYLGSNDGNILLHAVSGTYRFTIDLNH